MPRPKYRRVWKRQPGGGFKRVWQRIRYATFRADRYIIGLRPIREVAPKHRAAYRNTIINAAKAAKSCGEVWICRSSYRTYTEQVALYAAYRNGTGNLAAVPGTSRHETGRALDLGDPDNRDIGETAHRRDALRKHGFTFPVLSEDWHVEWGAS